MNSVDKLREWAISFDWMYDKHKQTLLDQVSAVEREIERDYMRLPEIADGTVRFGDCIESGGAYIGPIDCISYGAEGDICVWQDGNSWEVCGDEKHYHAPTVEDVLEELLREYDRDDSELTNGEIIERFAAKLRLAGDE